MKPDPCLTQEDLCLTPAKRAKDRSASRDRMLTVSFEGQLEYVGSPGVDEEVFPEVIPLTDLDRGVRHDLTILDYEFLPSVI